jgi:YfiH family protein
VKLDWIQPAWPAPPQVRALSTTRTGGVSTGPYASLNLGDHVGDRPEAVAENRRRLAEAAGLPGVPAWLRQVHGTRVVTVIPDGPPGAEADAATASRAGAVCAVLTADCLPVLFTCRLGRRVAAAHAGWRGLAGGVLEAVISCMDEDPAELIAWIGPGIGPSAFEVGPEVREAFVRQETVCKRHFTAGHGDRWFADLAGLARDRLERAGVRSVFGGDHCTFSDAENFFSYRRDGRCGRMATLIWISGEPER